MSECPHGYGSGCPACLRQVHTAQEQARKWGEAAANNCYVVILVAWEPEWQYVFCLN